MKRFFPILTVTALSLAAAQGVSAASSPDYSGTWDMRAYGDDGTQVTQTVTLYQAEKNGEVFLSGYNFSGAIKNGSGSVYKVTKYKEYSRIESGSLTFTGRSVSGSGQVRDVYLSGDIVVTKYRITGSRRG
ncbi:hypothetical protein [Deinococcus sp.]|uniref:hypothetical protein n=1 Tax=Deinococcus sp. TaxID=47478 RepID=UPI003CC539E2